MIYLDHHATTPVAPEVLQAMLPYFSQHFGNAGSVTHQVGRTAAEVVTAAVAQIAQSLGGRPDNLVVTSGATESCNLAILGSCLHPRQKRRKVVTVCTEHPAVLDPVKRLEKHGFETCILPVQPSSGLVDLNLLSETIDDRTALCSVMLANNEIGTIQPLADVAEICRSHDCILHTDATQAVGRIPVNLGLLGVDLLSFSAHKFYGPKGIGGLLLADHRRTRLHPQIVGGGQQANRRSGTLNVPGIVGMSAALRLTTANLQETAERMHQLRGQLWAALLRHPISTFLNGPDFGTETAKPDRLPGNLNCGFEGVEGQSLMQLTPELAVSSGSACTSASPDVSHVLRAIGRSEDQARSSLRFGLGRDTTEDEIARAADWIALAIQRLKQMG